MSNSKKNIPAWARSGHAKPVTRREFLAHGLIPFAGSMLMPSWLQLLSPNPAQAAGCDIAASGLIPFMQLNLEGGAGLAANYVPMDEGRQLLPSYNIVGLGNNQFPVTRVFNNAPFAGNGISKILTGIQSVCAPETMNKTAFLGLCVQSRDDSRENAFGLNGLIHRAGLIGTKLPHLGNRDTNTGINQDPVMFSPPSPLILSKYSDLSNSLGFTAYIGNIKQGQKEKLAKLMGDLNTNQARKLASKTGSTQIQELLECVGVKNTQLVKEGTGSIDPRKNPDVSGVWKVDNSTDDKSENLVLSAMTYNVLTGQAGTASYSRGGYDYHNQDRQAETDVKDREAGVIIGQILETARVMNKPIFLTVTTDGGVSADSETPYSHFMSDRGPASMMYVFMFHPSGRPATTDFQIGHYTRGQAADTTFPIGGSPEMASQAVLLNYLKFNKRMDLYSKVVPAGRGLDNNIINQLVKVA